MISASLAVAYISAIVQAQQSCDQNLRSCKILVLASKGSPEIWKRYVSIFPIHTQHRLVNQIESLEIDHREDST